MQNRSITISIGGSRKATSWKPQVMTVSDLYTRLSTPIRSAETMHEYTNMKKSQQDELKDVGGFVAGTLNGQRRKACAVTGRDVITLDFDNIPAWGTDDVLRACHDLGVSFCVYSTRKHVANAPRLRIIIPLDRTVSADEYEPIARRLAERLGIAMADPTTFDVSRLMYWPSVCSDGDFVYQADTDAPLCSADNVLNSYDDWRDFLAWPQVPGAGVNYRKLATRQGDPEQKKGMVGAFCRTYDIPAVLDLIPGIYAPVEGFSDRYSYCEGSTIGGAVLYDGGKFLYSHHATDPCSGKLVNAFDLIRFHRFGDLDESADPKTPTNRLPSYKAMCEFALQDKKVLSTFNKEQLAQVQSAFADEDVDDTDWLALLVRNSQSGQILSTIDNVCIILENDPVLKGGFAFNEFASRGEVLGALPWNNASSRRMWNDTDSNGLYWYLEKIYKISGRGNIDAALDIHANKHAFNEVQDYLTSLNWDGVRRLDTLLVDYLGAGNSDYVRSVTRIMFTAAVARAMNPGCKFDNMLILTGPQGIGKSTLLQKMAHGWFNDGIRTFEGKEASELLQGVWLVEIAELDAFRRTDISRIKQFLSLNSDRFRAAYARSAKEFPRRCVFFGTTNHDEFLQDTTGNRRFWPVEVGVGGPKKSVFKDLTGAEVDQLWAEAVTYWRCGEALYLAEDIEKAAILNQEQHREVSVREGIIKDFIEREIPVDWLQWDLDRRRAFWNGVVQIEVPLVPRDRICALEIWCELLGGRPRDIKPADTREINNIIHKVTGWKRKHINFGKFYATSWGFQATQDVFRNYNEED